MIFCRNHLLVWKLYFWILDKRLKWYGIEPLEESDAKKLDDMYGNDCKCEFKCDFKCTCCQFKCTCGWKENITLNEHKSFQDSRKVSKPGIQGQPNLALLIVDRNITVSIDLLQSLTRNTTRSKSNGTSNPKLSSFIWQKNESIDEN